MICHFTYFFNYQMSISTNISGATLKLFDDSLINHKKELLREIWEEYLKEKIDFDQFIDTLLSRPKKIKRKNIETDKVNVDETLCRAKVWNHLTKTYSQCKFKPCGEISDFYCEKHSKKRNYGDF